MVSQAKYLCIKLNFFQLSVFKKLVRRRIGQDTLALFIDDEGWVLAVGEKLGELGLLPLEHVVV